MLQGGRSRRGGFGFRQQTHQQHFQPQPRLHAQAQLLLTSPQAGLPLQQSLPADALGQLRQLIAELGGDAGELRAIGRRRHQNQVSENAGQALEHSARIAAPIQQAAAGFHQLEWIAAGQCFCQGNQVLLRHCAE